jgi:uncharacterized membrane protein
MRQPADSAVPNLEKVLGRVLFLGVAVSTVLLALGLAFWMGVPYHPHRDLPMQLGLLVLMITPAVRVLVSCVEYIREGDWLFASLTGTVLLVLGGSVLVAFLR